MSEFATESVNPIEPVELEPSANPNPQVTFSSNACESMIKWCLLELATNPLIDHRDYCRDKARPSPLALAIQSHSNSFDQGIASLAQSIVSNNHIIEIVEGLGKLHADPDESDEIVDEIYDFEVELFELFINLSGLYEINSLHGDYADEFKEHLIDLVYSR
jgi:hypothetical protein